MNNFTTTICAIATASGSAAIATIRLSGSDSISITESVFFAKNSNQTIVNQEGNTIVFGEIIDGEDVVDEVLISIFRNPKSYTGEDSIEISCHASRYIQQRILELLIGKGAVLAQAGEFTQRAFMNGKMDLAQAEGVVDLIASESKAMHKISIQQLKGGFSSELELLRTQMLNFSALIELELDFSEEDVEFADRTDLTKLIQKIDVSITRLIDSFTYGNAIKNGVPVAIVGRPNAGKSTLLNALLNEDRAIVSDIPGTTRDTIEELLVIEGVQFRFIDTAGLRSTNDEIEKIGVERALEKIKKSAIYLYLFDAEEMSIDEVVEDLSKLNQVRPRIILANKSDLLNESELSILKKSNLDLIPISAKEKKSIDVLKSSLLKRINHKENQNNIVVSNIRHFEALSNAKSAIDRVLEGIAIGVETDLLAMDMRDASYFIGEITGNISNDELLGHIFKNFCIGK